MQKLTRRGLASFGVAALLVLAPITAAAAYADDEVVVSEAPVEVVAETPVEIVSEAPTEVVAEAPVEAPIEGVADAPAAPSAEEPIEIAASEDEAAASRLLVAAPTPRAGYTPPYSQDGNAPIYLSIVGNTLTATWDATTDGTNSGYDFQLYDYETFSFPTSGHTFGTSFSAKLIPGHRYQPYFHDYYGQDDYQYGYGNFLFVQPAAPSAPTDVVAERLPNADGFSLSWAAPIDNVRNPVTGYAISVTTNSITTTFTTTSLKYDFTGLAVGDSYSFVVAAVASDGQLSAIATTDATLDAIAPTVPQSLVLTRTGDTLSGTWAAPVYDGGSPIDSYLVGLFADGVGVEDEFDVVGNSFTFDTDADYSVEYSLLVVAFSKVGYGSPIGESNTVERADFVPSKPSAHVTTLAYKNPMINVNWDFASQEGSEVRSVTVTVYDTTGAVVQRETHSDLPGRTSVTLLNLANDTTYTATVVATNAAGSSPESAPVEIRTNGLVPPAYTAEQVALASSFSKVSVALTGTELVAHIDGLPAGAWVFGHAYSTPSALGWTQVDAAGNARWSISGAGLASGATHTLAVQNSFGELLGSATFAIAAPAVVKAALAHTGTDSFSWIAIALAMLVVGAISTATKVRRRARA